MKAILALLLVIAIVVCGCSSNAPVQNIKAVDTTQGNTANTKGTTQASNQAASATTQKTTDSNSNSKLKNILAAAVKYKVTYDITAAGTSSQMTQYISGGKIRIDMNTAGMEVQTYYMNNEYDVCNKATGNWMCQKLDYTPSTSDTAQNDVKNNIDTYNVVSSGTKIVAGVNTNCYTITTKDGTVEYCYSNDNVPLYIKMTSGNITSEMTATSYSTTVTDQDFVVPAKVGAGISTNPADYANYQP